MDKLAMLSRFLHIDKDDIRRGLDSLRADDAYLVWDVPKPSGGKRTLTAPQGELAALHYAIANVLYPHSISPISYAYINGRGPIGCAKKHLHANYMFSFDIKDAYPSTNRKLLKKHLSMMSREAGFSGLEDMLLDIICYPPLEKDSHLPQGSWTSNILFNLVMKHTDIFLQTLSRKYGRTITRYSDGYDLSSVDPIPSKARNNYVSLTETLNDHVLTIKKEKTTYVEGLPLPILGMEIVEKDGIRRLDIPPQRMKDYYNDIEFALEIRDFREETLRTLRGYQARIKAVCEIVPEDFKRLYHNYLVEYKRYMKRASGEPELW